MTDTIDRLVLMLVQERDKISTLKNDRRQAHLSTMAARADLRRTERDLQVAEDKIDEWISYSKNLVAMLLQRKVLSEKIPPAPEPFVREIPF
jgi:predicted  nucleic acid-binding Zn-ribbon protein